MVKCVVGNIFHFFFIIEEGVKIDLKEEILFDFQSFVAEFGGALGLFLGFSFVMVWDWLMTLNIAYL